MPTTSVTWVTLRVPSRSREACTMMLSAEDICSRVAFGGKVNPPMAIMLSMRDSASRGELA